MQIFITLQEIFRKLRDFEVIKMGQNWMLTWRVFAEPVTYFHGLHYPEKIFNNKLFPDYGSNYVLFIKTNLMMHITTTYVQMISFVPFPPLANKGG